jgi:uncharacterized protein (TIGR02266 family)
MFEIATEETYQDGQIIFEEGSSGDWIYAIQSGKVEISKKVGGQKIVIEVLQTGEIFGELGFVSKATRSATARAVGETVIGIIDRGYLDQEFNKLSSGFQQILRSLATRLKKASEGADSGRKDPRIPKSLSLTFKTKDSLIKAYSENASGGGIFIRTPKPLPKGERLLIKLQLPDHPDAIKIEGEVAWIRSDKAADDKRQSGMGIKFLEINGADQQKLKECLKR